MNKKISDYSPLIEGALHNLHLPGGALAGLYEPIEYAMTAGGKRLRPSLTLMTCEAFGGDMSHAMPAALGLELFHNFTLLHDDVMDCSDIRRGRPTVHVKWDTNTAILSGDTMLTLATQQVAEVPDNLLRPVLATFNDMALRVYEGQRLDMDFESRSDVKLDDYLRMVTDKTGHLIGAAARIGALIGGASEADAAYMAEYGVMLGVAFQIQDDYLDVYGDASTFGKPIGGDINNNKKTYLLLSALATATPEAEALRSALNLPAGDSKVKTVTRLYDRLGVANMCREAIAHYSARAMAALKSTSLPESAREPFRLLVEKLTGRRK
ncbi:MAG: polyprenyl synthetase family protein [Muribaculaceae bacterium]|nr:polyprenyl synthetase family protein [Muribaculaceae bacterium]